MPNNNNYRKRPLQLQNFFEFFQSFLETNEDEVHHRIYIVKQTDSLPFNRHCSYQIGFGLRDINLDFPSGIDKPARLIIINNFINGGLLNFIIPYFKAITSLKLCSLLKPKVKSSAVGECCSISALLRP